MKGLKLCPIQKDVVSNYAYFPVVFDEKVFGKSRDEVCELLAENGIFSRKYFYPLTNTFDCYKDRFNADNIPIALEISKRILTLPLYAELMFDLVNKIYKFILKK